MEGVLYKWTNYLSGWQPRWFLLCGGILSYYDSQEDAWKGCKGSIQMAVCEIQVHPADNTRMDLIIPGEQYFYLKARNAVERQKWLVALGTAKACLTDSRTQKEREFTENTEVLKTKMSELRLYCNLLVQQVHKTKEASISSVSEPESEIDMGALLKSTCDTFLKTLEECMQIANIAFTSELLHQTPPGSPHLAVLRTNKIKHSVLSSHTSTERQTELSPCENGSVKPEINLQEQTFTASLECLNLEANEGSGDVSVEDDIAEGLAGSVILNFGRRRAYQQKSFWSHVMQLCPFWKINQKFITNKEEFDTLQKIVLHEVNAGVAQVRNSATEALLWLKRGLKFLKGFLTEVKNGEKNIQTALNNAYGKTLRQHHGWVVRGVFALALRAAPTYEDFVAALSVEECDPQEETFYKGMQRDLNIYLPAMEKQLNILDTLYEVHGLESDEVV
ncbi:pleckstrin homology domain-containing family A member 8 isoform X3 [Apus apus]|uniref:pleckstrin homology domain-containing family A member 8 isoform X3 n=1 Tax=Apus apus TaxID=8895 RepID=UPI0021F8493F|nr:pleckstrin homology domain-containing family A member 8 isoform X3 [Apus apus]